MSKFYVGVVGAPSYGESWICPADMVCIPCIKVSKVRGKQHSKNAFQLDAYRPLQWPSGGGGSVCPGGVCLGRRGVCQEGVSVQWGV